MRLFWLRLSALVAQSILAGCMSPASEPLPAPTEDVQPGPSDELPLQDGHIQVTASDAAFAEMRTWLGSGNTITVQQPLQVERADVSVSVPAGASVSYTFDDEHGLFQFSAPKPTVSAKIWGWTVSPSLSRVTIKPDGTGVATTGLGLRYGFRWLVEEETTAPAVDLPEVWAYSQPGCAPCVRAKRELEAAGDLPFRVVWKEDAPAWLENRPAFWWHATADTPSQADVSQTRQRSGWSGVAEFLAVWKANRR